MAREVPKVSDELEYEMLYKRARAGDWYGCYVCYGEDRTNMNIFAKSLTDMLIPEMDREFAVSRYDMREVAVQDALADAETVSFMAERKLVIIDYAMFFTALEKKMDGATETSTSGEADAPNDAGEDGEDAEEADREESDGGLTVEAGGAGKAKKASKPLRKKKTRIEHDLKMLADYLLKPSSFAVVLFLVPGQKLDERKKLVTMIKKIKPDERSTVLVPFEQLSDARLFKWLYKQMNRRKLVFASGVDEYFVHVNGHDVGVLRSELDKLSLNVEHGTTITAELVDKYGVRTFEQDVFKLMEMILDKKLGAAHETLLELYKYPKEGNEFLVLNLLARQFRVLLGIKEWSRQGWDAPQIAGAVGSPPFVVRKLMPLAKRWDAEKLAAILAECADLDYAFKTGRVIPRLALEVLVLKLAS